MLDFVEYYSGAVKADWFISLYAVWDRNILYTIMITFNTFKDYIIIVMYNTTIFHNLALTNIAHWTMIYISPEYNM